MVRRTRPQMCNCTSGNLVIPGSRYRAPRNDDRSSLQMLGKEREAARPGDIGTGLVVASAFVAVKAVLRAGIAVNLDIGPLGLDGIDIGQRNARVLFAEMQLCRHLRLVVGKANNGAAVIANGGRQARQFGRSRIGDAAAEAEADNADRSDIPNGVDRGLG